MVGEPDDLFCSHARARLLQTRKVTLMNTPTIATIDATIDALISNINDICAEASVWFYTNEPSDCFEGYSFATIEGILPGLSQSHPLYALGQELALYTAELNETIPPSPFAIDDEMED